MRLKYLIYALILAIPDHAAQSQEVWKLGLKDALAIARKRNPEILLRSYEIEGERGRRLQGISPPSPLLSVDYDFIPTGSAVRDYDERTFRFSQTIEFPLTTFLRGTSMTSSIGMREEEKRATQAFVEAGVKRAYVHALLWKNKITLAVDNLEISNEFAQKADIRYTVGEGTHLEKVTAGVQYSEDLIRLEEARSGYAMALNQLILLLGNSAVYRADAIELTDSLAYTEHPVLLEELLEQARKEHPLLKASSLGIAVANTRRALAWSELLPTFELGYSFQTREGISDYYGVSVGFSVPLWFLFDQRGKIRESSAAVARAEVENDAMFAKITVSVRNAFTRRLKTEREFLLYRDNLEPQSREILRVARASYSAGEIGYLEFLQAKQTLLTVRNGYLEALAEYHIAQADLEEAIGLYQESHDEMEE